MKGIAFAGLVTLVLVLIVGSRSEVLAGCCGTDAPKAPAKAADVQVIEQKTCPVMGGAINKDIFTDYKGRKIYFCCPMCIDTFKKDPEKYVKKVDDEIAKLRAEKK